MARIRSIHPGLFSDPEFADLSSDAQVFYLGLLTEADDNGIFEWKPSTLRIRLRPLKDGSVDPLLGELEVAGKLKSYEINGRKYGAIRNFRKFQRPKAPKAWHPITDDFRNWVGLTETISEICPQREDGGGRRKGKEETPASKNPTVAESALSRETQPQASQKIGEDWNPSEAATATLRSTMPWLTGALYDERMQDFREWCRAKAVTTADPEATWSSFMRKTRPVETPRVGSKSGKRDALPAGPPWAKRVADFRKDGFWLADWGPKPNQPGCWAPADILDPSPRYSATEAA